MPGLDKNCKPACYINHVDRAQVGRLTGFCTVARKPTDIYLYIPAYSCIYLENKLP